ncbi:MAG: PDC sensor domain-containing protein, partial [Bacteroidales bacterium]|nr:PDC sensor domain-containing protein [Bacteroidales bacterium]
MKNPSELLYQRIQRKEKMQALLHASYMLLIGILSVGVYILKEYEQYKKEGERTTKSIIEIQARQLSDFYTDQLQDVESISSHWLILRYLDLQFNSDFVGTNSKNLVQDYLFRRKQEHGFSDIVLYDTDGSTLLSTNPALVYTDVDIPAALDKSLREQHPFVSDVYRSNQNARLYLDFIVPIVDSQDKLRAGLMYKVDVEKNISSLFGNWQITTYKPVIQLIQSDALGQPASVNLTLN